MGRTLKDGTFKPKPSAQKAADWMTQDPTPLPVFRRGTTVKVFNGSGWQTAVVEDSTSKRCQVFIKMGAKRTIVYDRRNIKEGS